jgi:hypothetical protein
MGATTTATRTTVAAVMVATSERRVGPTDVGARARRRLRLASEGIDGFRSSSFFGRGAPTARRSTLTLDVMTRRAAAGFLVAPLLATVLLGCWDVLDGRAAGNDLAGFFVFGLVTYVYCGIFTIGFAVPSFLLLNRFNLVRWWSAPISGAVIGLIVALALRIPSTSQSHNSVYLSLIGAASATAFWFVWRR